MTRSVTTETALDHPRRLRLFTYIRSNPGGTFRELVRETRVPAGTARHHLNILLRTRFIVEKRHRCTLRFFPNHGEYDDTWHTVVMLREAALDQLHRWILDHPGCIQKEVLSAMSAQGWNRSTTQHRLNRLMEAGLVTVRAHGRFKRYTAHILAQPTGVGDGWAGLSHFSATQDPIRLEQGSA